MRNAVAALGLVHAAALALAGDAGVVEARVLGPKKKAVAGAPVVAWVKAWPGGQFSGRAFDAETDAKGRVRIADAIPPGTRFGVYVSVAAQGSTLVSHYHWSGEPAPLPPIELTTEAAAPLRLRFTDEAGEAVSGVEVFPEARGVPGGPRHTIAAPGRAATLSKSGKDGVADAGWFLPGEWATVGVRRPGGDWESRSFAVPAGRSAVVDVARTEEPTPDLDLRAGDDARKRFFLMGPKAGDAAPERGYALLLVLPGGDGGAGFHDFVRASYDTWVDSGFVWAELVAPVWKPDPEIIWPTETARIDGMEFTTEEFVEAVVAAVRERVPVDPKRVFTLSWSSSGPAAYRIASLAQTSVTGQLVAMSVWHPKELASLDNVKGRPFFILHSPQDQRCPLRLAEEARTTLTRKGAVVEWATYEGGHGWAGESEAEARRGLHWLLERTK